MGVRLSEIEARRSVPVTVRGVTFNVSYLPEAVQLEHMDLLEEIRAVSGQEKSRLKIEKMIPLLLVYQLEWDLLDDDDQPIPVTAETLEVRSINMLGLIMSAVMGDQNPNAVTPPSSGATIAPVADKDELPTT